MNPAPLSAARSRCVVPFSDPLPASPRIPDRPPCEKLVEQMKAPIVPSGTARETNAIKTTSPPRLVEALSGHQCYVEHVYSTNLYLTISRWRLERGASMDLGG